ncbi:apolipoprotein A-I-like [Spea bombifrons]|uniref:apolipoprotein A-I-like n=1 Tax=Spea bombifrons TaxID=233779 RepID=UPI00234B07F6|nr:apolipoprotein A-I-like [Spea bombifrons]
MKGLVISLALLFLTGTQARFLWQNEEPHTPIQQAREVIESYLNKVRDIGREAVNQIESSDFGKQLDLKITEKFDTLSSNALNLKKQLNPYVDQVREQVSKELEKDIPIIKEKIRPILEVFQKRWVEEVKAYREKVAPLSAELHRQTKENLQAFAKRVLPLAEEVRDKLRSEVDTLRTDLAPYSNEIRQKVVDKLEEIKANAGPRAEEYRAQVSQYIENLKERFAPVAQNIRERLLPVAEEAKTKLAKLVEVVRAKLNQQAYIADMKILILTSTLLFLTGTQGRFLWQNEESKSFDSDVLKYAENIFRLYVNAGKDFVKNLESSDFAKELKVKENLDFLRTELNNAWDNVDKYVDKSLEEVKQEIKKDYPVFVTKVVPVLEEFKNKWEENALSIAKDFLKVALNLFGGIKTEFQSFFKNIEPIAEKGRDTLRSEVEALRTKLAPYIDDLREEVKRNREELKDEFGKIGKELREAITKELTEITELVKPYIDKLKERFDPYAEELKKELSEIIEDIRSSYKNDS